MDLFWLPGFVVWTSMVETCEIQGCSLLDLLNLLLLGCCLRWLSGCICILIVVGSFFGWSFPPAGWLRATSPTTSCMLCRCRQVVLKLVLLSAWSYETPLSLLFSCLFVSFTSSFGNFWLLSLVFWNFVSFPLLVSFSMKGTHIFQVKEWMSDWKFELFHCVR